MYLDDEEILLVEGFCNNEKLVDAVKKVFLAPIYEHGVLLQGVKHNPLMNGTFSLVSQAPELPDEVLGQYLRAKWAGVTALENGFEELKKFKSKKAPDPTEPENEGV